MLRFLILIPVLLLSLCQCSTPRQYYMLKASGTAPTTRGVGIGIGPIQVPSYLERQNLVLEQGSHHFAIAESHRWTSNLGENIGQVIGIELGRALNTGIIRQYPWNNDQGLDYQVVVDVRHFHGNDQGDALIDATWRIYSTKDHRLLSQGSWAATEALHQDGYQALVAAQSRLLQRLTQQIFENWQSAN